MENQIIVAVKGIVYNNDKYLIIKRWSNDEVGAGTWEMPGGKIEFGEKLEEALIRETKEETGLDISVEKLLYATQFLSNPNRQVIIISYLCCADNTDVVLSEEHTDFLWITKNQFKDYVSEGILRDLEKNNILDILD